MTCQLSYAAHMLGKRRAVLHHAHALDLVVTNARALIGCIARRHAMGVCSFSQNTRLLMDRWQYEQVASWMRSLRGHVVSLQVYSGSELWNDDPAGRYPGIMHSQRERDRLICKL